MLYNSYGSISCSMKVSDIFNVEKCHDLEIRVRDHSRSLKPTGINPPPMINIPW